MHLDEKSEYRPPPSPRQDTFSFAPSPETPPPQHHPVSNGTHHPVPHSARTTFPKSALIKVRQCRVFARFFTLANVLFLGYYVTISSTTSTPHARHGGMKVYTAPTTMLRLAATTNHRDLESVVHSSHNQQNQPESTFSNDDQTREITRH